MVNESQQKINTAVFFFLLGSAVESVCVSLSARCGGAAHYGDHACRIALCWSWVVFPRDPLAAAAHGSIVSLCIISFSRVAEDYCSGECACCNSVDTQLGMNQG